MNFFKVAFSIILAFFLIKFFSLKSAILADAGRSLLFSLEYALKPVLIIAALYIIRGLFNKYMKGELKLSKLFTPIFLRRVEKFKSLRRGYYSFLIIVIAYIFSFFSEFFVNSRPFSVVYNGQYYFTVYDIVPLKKAVSDDYESFANKATELRKKRRETEDKNEKDRIAAEAKQISIEAKKIREIKSNIDNGRMIKDLIESMDPKNKVSLVMYPYGPIESLLNEFESGVYPPTPPESKHWLGTDDRGRDVFARLVYGFRTSMSFAIIYVLITYAIGIIVGAFLGYYGGTFDIIVQRFVEIWSSLPFLYTVMIISAIMTPNFLLLIGILCLWGWIGTTYFIRAEYFKEKNKDYVQAAIAIGVKDSVIMFKHILPNSLTPIISFAPFAIVGSIGSLVSLDFLGFGLPAPTPSWGELLGQGVGNLTSYWLILSPMGALFLTLLLVSFTGEAVREAFDPKVYSRLR